MFGVAVQPRIAGISDKELVLLCGWEELWKSTYGEKSV